jgi:hypothetical protein
MDKLLTALRLAADLHLGTAGSDVDQIARLNTWIATEDGHKVIGDIDQLLAEFDFPLVIAIRGK